MSDPLSAPIANLESLRDALPPDTINISTPNSVSKDPDFDLAVKARQWFLEAIEHPLWKNYIKEADEDQGFYVGGENQWSKDGSKEDLARLKALQKTVISINHVKSIVDVLDGYQRQNRFDIKATPQGMEDDDAAKIMTYVLKHVQDNAEVGEYLSEGFKMSLIRGMAAYNVGIDWTTDTINGEIDIRVLKPGRDVIWDPFWRRYDLSDCAYILEYRWVRIADLVAMYPEKKQEIESSLSMLQPIAEAMVPLTITQDGPSSDAYGSTTEHPMEYNTGVQHYFFDPDMRRLLIVEPWFLRYESQWVVKDKSTGKVLDFPNESAAREYAGSDPKILTAIERKHRLIRTGTVIPATNTILEGPSDTPYDNDREHYPQAPIIADKIDDVVMGVVRNLKDPQRVENKRIAQCMDLVSRYGNLRPYAEEGSLIDPSILNEPFDTRTVWVKPGKKPPGFLTPEGLREIVNMLVELTQQMKIAPREVSGVNSDLLGIKGDTSSGIAIARRQAQGQVISAPYFDNLRRTRKIVGQRLARRVQQRFSTAQTLRLVNDLGDPIQVQLNPPEFRDMEQEVWARRQKEMTADPNRPMILRDVGALKFDVVISESPATPTARQAALMSLMDLLKEAPQMFPAVVDVILELADVPDRQKILQRIRALQAAQTGQPPGPPGEGGGPTPGANVPVVPGAPTGPNAGVGPSSIPANAPLPVPPVKGGSPMPATASGLPRAA